MNCERNFYRLALLILITSCTYSHVLASDILTNPRYTDLQNEFLNINPDLFFEIDIAGMTSGERSVFIQGAAAGSPLKLEEKISTNSLDESQFGATHSCTNSFGDDAICWYSTGGSIGAFSDGTCGDPIQGDYATAVAATAKHCNVSDVDWSGLRFWLGTQNRTEFVIDQFPGANNNPVNRLCIEMTLPDQSNLYMDYSNPKSIASTSSSIEDNPHLSQLVNPEVAGAHLRDIMYEWGTYISPRLNDAGTTTDNELGGTYQNGGSHFYHKFTRYDTVPADRIFAIDTNTLVACMSNIPSSGRAGMRPIYTANPLLTLGGVDENGLTTAPSYLSHITRVYFDFVEYNAAVNYPFDISVNKMWMMYENNDIVLADKKGGTLGVDVIEQGDSASYPITLFNNANIDRTYRVFMAMGEKLLRTTDSDDFQLFEDNNGNHILDASERSTLIPANSTFTIPANRVINNYILVHTPDFNSAFVLERHGKNFLQGTISVIEEGRLRSANYAVRTWEASPEDIPDKSQWIKDTQYPSDDSEWKKNKEFNLEKNIETNNNLIRNTPDFRTVTSRFPKPPSNLQIVQ
jgi:hypothetical protein